MSILKGLGRLLGSKSKLQMPVWDGRPPVDEVDAIYKTDGCSEHTFYVATKRPVGNWVKVGDELPLTGTGHHKSLAQALERFFVGDKRWIVLERDRNNLFDAHAVKVFGVCTDRRSGEVSKDWIGWVSREDNQALCEHLEIGPVIGTPKIFFYGLQTAGLRFNVFVDDTVRDQKEREAFGAALALLKRPEGASAKEIGVEPGASTITRDRLNKLSNDEPVYGALARALEGYRIEKRKVDRGFRYYALPDASKIHQKTGWDPDAKDPMGAEVPEYVLHWSVR